MSDKAKNYTRSLMAGQESTPYDSTYTIVRGIYNQLGGEARDFDSTYSIVLAILQGLEDGTISPGSQVSIDETLATGSLIAVLTIDDVETPIYIPAGAAGSGSLVTFTQIQSSGSKIAEIGIDGVSTDIFAPEVNLSEYATTESLNSFSSSVGTMSASFDQRINDIPSESGPWAPGAGDSSAILGTNQALGSSSVAHGYQVTASGDYSHAEGIATLANNPGEHAEGKFNATASSQIFSIGGGEDEASRKNIVSVVSGSNPKVYIYGVGGYNGTNPSAASASNDLLSGLSRESWTFTLTDSSSVVKSVLVG